MELPDRLRRPIAIPARADLLAALALLALPLFVFRRAILGFGVLYERDILTFFYPQAETFVRSIAAGSLPLWNPYRGFGQPFLADPETEIFYPLTWLNLVLSPNAYFTLFMVFHVALAGLGMYLLLRAWGLGRGGALLGGLVFMGSGPLLSLSTWHHLAGGAYIPLVLLFAHRAFSSGRRRDAVLFGFVQGLQVLAGSAEMVIFAVIATLAYSIHERKGTRIRTMALAWAIGLGLSACQWVPTLAIVAGSTRRALPSQIRTVFSLNPLQLPELLVRVSWAELPLATLGLDDPRELGAPFLTSLYLGPAALALVLGAAFAKGARRRTSLVLLAAALLVALGRHAPAYRIAVLLIPPLRILRYPVKFMVLALFAWSHLAGAGFEGWREGLGKGTRQRILVGLPLLALGLGLAVATWLGYARAETWGPWLLPRRPGLPGYDTVFGPSLAKLAVSAAVAGAAFLLYLVRGPTGALLLAALTTLDLASAHENLHPVAPQALVRERPEVLKALDPQARLYVYDYSVMTNRESIEGRKPERPWPYKPVLVPRGWSSREALYLGVQQYLNPPAGERWGLYGSYDIDLVGLDPPARARLDDDLRDSEGSPTHLRLLRLGAVSQVLALVKAPFWDDLEKKETVPSLFADPIQVLGVPGALPRTYAVGRAQVVPEDEQALRTMLDPSFDPRTRVVLAEGTPMENAAFSGTSTIVDMRPDRVMLRADLGAPGFVVLVDGYDPGWVARVDSVRAPLLRANTAFRAVGVPAGRHVIEFIYRPRSAFWGLAATILTLLGALFVVLQKGQGQELK